MGEHERPPGWVRARIGDLFRVEVGATPSRQRPDYWGGSIPWVSSGEVQFCRIKATRETITDAGLANSSTKVCPKGTILLGMIGQGRTRGQTAILDIPACNNQNAAAIVVPETPVPPMWVYYFLEGRYSETRRGGSGNNQPALNKTKVQGIELPLAPLPEQRRIVAAIEQHFSRLDAAVATLERVKAKLGQTRASVLKAAVEGRLVPTEDAQASAEGRDYEHASVLLERILAERRKKHDEAQVGAKRKKRYKEPVEPDVEGLPVLPEGWVWATVSQVSECIDRLRVPINKKERLKRQGSIPYYGANGQVGWIDTPIFNEPLVLVVEDETFVGRTKPFSYIIRGPSWVNNHAHVLRPITPMEVGHINVTLARYPFIPLTTGTTGRRKLTQKALNAAPYPLPPLAEQHRIVAEVDRQLSVLDEVGRLVDANLARCARLRQAILKRAFEGRLVPQDPNDEPASVLLQRIKAQATATPKKKNTRRRKGTP